MKHAAPSFVEPLESRTLLSSGPLFAANIDFQQASPAARAPLLGPAGTARSWEIRVPNGLYRVGIVAGDAARRGVYRIDAEGVRVVDGTTTQYRKWFRGAQEIKVTDGKLTLSSGAGAVNNQLRFVRIRQLRAADAPLVAARADQIVGGVSDGHFVAANIIGGHLLFRSVSFAPGLRSVQVQIAANAAQDGKVLEFRLDRPDGPLIAALAIEGQGDGSEFWTQSAPLLSGVSGTHNLYVRFAGSGTGGHGTLNTLRFSSAPYVTLLPLGDSLTEGRPSVDSYRYRLWHMLNQAGWSFDFAGSGFGVQNGFEPSSFAWDLDHEGHTGVTTATIRDSLSTWQAGQPRPDRVLLYAGTNDLGMRISPAVVAANIGVIIARLRAINPNVAVYVAQIAPIRNVADSTVRDYNARLAALAGQLNTARSRIVLVDQYTGFNINAHMVDGVHPNVAGEQFLAERWFAALSRPL